VVEASIKISKESDYPHLRSEAAAEADGRKKKKREQQSDFL
jgi:hypothetical protein